MRSLTYCGAVEKPIVWRYRKLGIVPMVLGETTYVKGDRSYKIQQPEKTSGLSPFQLERVITYIQSHLDEEICLDEVAGYLGLSRYYFCRLFKKSTGLSPYQYVIQCRVDKAKHLLKSSDLSLGEIALACGFSHQSHLNRHFKRWTGMTPKRFAKSQVECV